MADPIETVKQWFATLKGDNEAGNARFFADYAVVTVNGIGTYRGRKACAGYFTNVQKRYRLNELEIKGEDFVREGNEVVHRFEWVTRTSADKPVHLLLLNRYVIVNGECVEMEQFFDTVDRERQFAGEPTILASSGGA
jgi:limonene-1,2-epoxide hydrolase